MRLALVALAGLGLLSCQKHSADPAGVPADIEAGFGQEFSLHYQQQVRLPSAARPALTMRMADLTYTYCPEGMKCFVASFAWPTLELTDAQGNHAELVLPKNAPLAHFPAPLDTTSLVVGGRRYAVVYSRWEVERRLASQEMPRKADFGLWLRLTEVRP